MSLKGMELGQGRKAVIHSKNITAASTLDILDTRYNRTRSKGRFSNVRRGLQATGEGRATRSLTEPMKERGPGSKFAGRACGQGRALEEMRYK